MQCLDHWDNDETIPFSLTINPALTNNKRDVWFISGGMVSSLFVHQVEVQCLDHWYNEETVPISLTINPALTNNKLSMV